MAVKLLGDLSASGNATFNSEVNLPSGGQVDWANGDARIKEGLVTNYSLSFQTYTGSALTTKMFIQSGGNVGIGTTSPSSNLHVHGAGGSGVATQIKVTQADDGAGHPGADAILQSSGWGEAFLKLSGHRISAAGGDLNVTSSSDLALQTNGANTRMFIKSDGNVGIGTTSPLEKLHVVGKINSSNNIVSNSTYTMFTGRSSRTVDDYGGLNKQYFKANLVTAGPDTTGESSAHGFADLRLQLANNAGNTNMSDIMTLRSGGNVGIGTTSPNEKLTVAGNIHAYAPSGINAGLFASTAAGATSIAIRSSGVTFFNAGNVGIGTDNPLRKLDLIVDATTDAVRIKNTNSNGGGLSVFAANGGGGGNRILTLGDSSENVKVAVIESGNVGIGTASPGDMLHIHATGNGYKALIVEDDARRIELGRDMIAAKSADGSSVENLYIQPAGNTAFATNSGNVGIGTTSPERLLHVKASDGNTSIIKIEGGNNTVTANGEINSRLEFGSNDGSVNSSGNVGGSIASVTENTNGAITGLAFSTFYQSRTPNDLAEAMRITGGGNVGIGTTSPGEKLHVVGAIKTSRTTGASENIFIYNQQTAKWGSSTYPGIIESVGNNSFLIGSSQNIPLHLTRSGAIALTIGTGGNVGIGTTTPDAPLTVHSSTDPEIRFGYSSTQDHRIVWDSSKVYIHADPENANASSAIGLGVDGTVGFFMDDEHDVGIGSTAPAAKLNVASTGTNAYSSTITKGTNMKGIINALSNNADDMVGVYFGTGTTSEGEHWSGITGSRSQSATDWSTQLNFYTHNEDLANITTATQKMVIKGNGNVGIGTTSPSEKLDVVGNIELGDGGSGASLKYNSTNRGTILVNGSEIMRLEAAGNVGIGTTSPQKKLDVYLGTNNAVASIAGRISSGEYAGLHFGYSETGNSNYRHSAIVFERDDASHGDARGKIHILNSASGSSSADLGDSRLTVLPSGNVGIGTTSPAQKLEVAGNIKIGDSNVMYLGAGNDLQIYHDGTNSVINNTTGNLQIYNNADDGDIEFISDDGSGGTATYFYLDGGGAITRVTKNFRTDDNAKLQLGSAGDASLYHNGTNTVFVNDTGHLIFENRSDDKDIYFKSDDGSGDVTTYFFLDGGSVATQFSQRALFIDNIAAEFGSSRDLKIYHDATNSQIANFTGDLVISNYSDDKDIYFKSDDGSGNVANYFYLDGSGTRTIFEKLTRHNDNVRADFGTDSDLRIFHDSSNSYIQSSGTGDIIIQQRNDDKDIVFQSDDGSGGVTNYIVIDGSTTENVFYKNAALRDSVKATFGNSNDLQIYHDASNSYIVDTGTGDLNIQADNNINIKKAGGGETKAVFTSDGAVELYYDNSKKFETTSAGVTITGAITATGDITAFSDARVKENIETIDNALHKVTQLRGVEYNKIGSEEKSIGVVAQEIREVLPEVVKENEDGMLSVAYGNITGVLIEAIKEQQKQIEELKAQLDGFTK